jgi:Flp pilus assembly protein TadD/ribosomal protein L40E
LAEKPNIKCRVCGAENPPGIEFCESCGVKLEAASRKEETDVDKLLEELIEAPGEGEGASAEGGKESIDVEKELVDELLDSLLIEEQAAPTEEFECPLCGTPLPVHAEVCAHCGARFAKVEAEETKAREAAPVEKAPAEVEEEVEAPVKVSVSEEDISKIKVGHGRLIDIDVAGTVVGLLAIFALGRMYDSTVLAANPILFVVFIVVAIAGMAVGMMLLRMSTSAIVQGDKLVKEGSYQDAIYYYDRAIRMGSKPASAWASKGVAFKRMGKSEDALHCQNVALKLDPENEIAWCNKGDVYFKSGDLRKAIECYDRAIELRPKYAIAWNNKGAALAVSKKFKEAKECQDKAVRLKPRYIAAWLNRGEVLARLGMRDEAQKCLDRAKALGA